MFMECNRQPIPNLGRHGVSKKDLYQHAFWGESWFFQDVFDRYHFRSAIQDVMHCKKRFIETILSRTEESQSSVGEVSVCIWYRYMYWNVGKLVTDLSPKVDSKSTSIWQRNIYKSRQLTAPLCFNWRVVD